MRPNNVVCHSSENESWEALQLFSVEVRKIFFLLHCRASAKHSRRSTTGNMK